MNCRTCSQTPSMQGKSHHPHFTVCVCSLSFVKGHTQTHTHTHTETHTERDTHTHTHTHTHKHTDTHTHTNTHTHTHTHRHTHTQMHTHTDTHTHTRTHTHTHLSITKLISSEIVACCRLSKSIYALENFRAMMR